MNVARDIIMDSKTLGRCFVPIEYMADADEELRILRDERNPISLGNEKLFNYSTRLFQLSNKLYLESVDGIRDLPHELRGSALALVEIYRGYMPAIQSSNTYPTKITVSKWKKTLIGFYCLYIKNIQYLFCASKPTKLKIVK